MLHAHALAGVNLAWRFYRLCLLVAERPRQQAVGSAFVWAIMGIFGVGLIFWAVISNYKLIMGRMQGKLQLPDDAGDSFS